jgi:O-antigen/teichoic acid export membrane protein
LVFSASETVDDCNIDNGIKNLTSKKVLIKGVIWNLLGKFLPMGIALFSIPLIIKGLGNEKFGILTLVWSIIGYASLFDLGLSRSVTQLVSKKLGENDTEDLPTIIWTSVFMLFCMSLIGSFVLSTNANYICQNLLKISPQYLPQAVATINLISFCLPIDFVSNAFGGVLASYQRFGITNLINMPLAMFNYIAPVLILNWTHQLDIVVSFLVIGRLISMVLTFFVCSRTVDNFCKIKFDLSYLKKMLSFGGWITVSNIISPIMVSFDRFFIASILSASMVAYYTTPFEVVMKMLLIPTCVVTVLFPAFSKELTNDLPRAKRMYNKALKYVFVALLIPVLTVILIAKPGLSLWINTEFANKSYMVAQILALGMLLVGSAFIPFALIQAKGKSDITAKFHMIELPIYIILLVVLIKNFGIVGAAMAWLIRVSLDFGLLYFYSQKMIFGKKKE